MKLTVTLQNNDDTPASIDINPGESIEATVIWLNADGTPRAHGMTVYEVGLYTRAGKVAGVVTLEEDQSDPLRHVLRVDDSVTAPLRGKYLIQIWERRAGPEVVSCGTIKVNIRPIR